MEDTELSLAGNAPVFHETLLVRALTASALLLLAAGVIFPAAFSGPGRQSAEIQAIMEVSGAVVSVTAALLILLLRRVHAGLETLLWPMAGLFLHALFTFFYVAAGAEPGSLWLDSCGILAGGIFFALVFLPERFARSRHAELLVWFSGTAVILFCIISLKWPELFPVVRQGGLVTRPGREIGITGCLLYAAACWKYASRHRAGGLISDAVFAWIAFLFAASGGFLSFSRDWSAEWWYWNIVQLLAYGGIFAFMLYWRQNFLCGQHLAAVKARESRDYLENLINHASAPIIIWDPQFKVVRLNRALEALLGRKSEELMGRSLASLFPAAQAPAVMHHIEKTLAGEASEATEIDVAHVDGSVNTLLWNSATVLAEGGKTPVAAITQGLDITARKLAENELRQAEEKYRSLAENSPDLVARFDRKLRYLYVNKAAAGTVRCSPEECIGKTMRETGISEPEAARLERLIKEVLETGRAREVEDDFLAPAGRQCLSIRLVPERGADGKVLTVLSIARDVTELRKSEEEHVRLMTAIEQAGESIVITNPEGLIQYANPAFEKITGYSRAEAVGRTPRILKSGKQDQAFYRELWEEISSGRTWQRRLVNKHKDGTLYTEDTTISPVRDTAGRIVNYVAVKKDITEQLHLENQFLQSQKMEAVGVLAGGVAHDFNNILTAIISYAGFMLKDLAPGDPMRADAQEILNASERAVSLTRQLLAFSRRQILDPRVVDLNSVLAGMAKMLKRLLGEYIELHTEMSGAPCLAKVDPGQLEQVIMNLAVNARDAMPKGGRIIFETGILSGAGPSFTARPDLPRGPLVRLAVRDNGAGMTEEVKKRIFEPFFTTKEQGKGTGLGLSTVFGIVKQSGGAVDVESQPGRGTTFSIYLPYSMNSAPEKGKDTKVNTAAGSETVLVVDDDETLRRLNERILKVHGYTVLTAGSGAMALAVLERHGTPVDLVLTDVVMPGMSGRELALEIARRKMGGRTLYMSGYTDDAIVQHGVLEPGIAFIYKPFTEEALCSRVREALDGPAGRAKA